MFFEKETLQFNILDVLELKQSNVNMLNSGRNFNALSFRFRADTVLKTDTKEYHLSDNYVSYFPARLDYSRRAEIDEMIVIHFDTPNYTTQEIECFLPQSPEIFAKLFSDILACFNNKKPGYKHRCSALLYEILAECYAQNFVAEDKRSIIQNSVDYMSDNYKKSDLSIKEIADKSFISEVYFRKLFKKEYGTSPQKYIINLRIQNAVGLISTGYYSLKEAALMSGYTDYKYFSSEFKKIKGVSPSEYLYNYRKK